MKAILSQTTQKKWFARLVVNGNTFQLLEEYKGEEGKEFWLKRLSVLNCPIEVKP